MHNIQFKEIYTWSQALCGQNTMLYYIEKENAYIHLLILFPLYRSIGQCGLFFYISVSTCVLCILNVCVSGIFSAYKKKSAPWLLLVDFCRSTQQYNDTKKKR